MNKKIQKILEEFDNELKQQLHDNDENSQSPQNTLYHYTSLESALKILENQEIWLTSYRDLQKDDRHELSAINLYYVKDDFRLWDERADNGMGCAIGFRKEFFISKVSSTEQAKADLYEVRYKFTLDDIPEIWIGAMANFQAAKSQILKLLDALKPGHAIEIKHSALYKYTVQYAEEQNSEKIWPDMQSHINYLSKVYSQCYEAQKIINDKPKNEIPPTLIAQQILLGLITDFIRSIQLLVTKGYPQQAAALAASIFELGHTGLYFQNKPDEAAKWLSVKDVSDKMPRLIGCNDWKVVVEKNHVFLRSDFQAAEYEVYKKLCELKHSHPSRNNNIRIINSRGYIDVGPYSDERSISYAWFTMKHAGRLAELVMDKCLQMNCDDVAQMRAGLNEKAIKRFGINDPFDTP